MEELLNARKSRIRLSEFKYILTRFYLSNYLKAVYFLILLLTIFCIVWISLFNDAYCNYYLASGWFISLEVILCFLVVIDVILQLYLIGPKKFFKNWLHLIDFIMSLVCVLEIVIALSEIFAHIYILIGLAILILRIFFMVIRIIILMKRSVQDSPKPLLINTSTAKPSMDDILESKIQYIKVAYRARLDTLGEEDEVLESSVPSSGSIWKPKSPES